MSGSPKHKPAEIVGGRRVAPHKPRRASENEGTPATLVDAALGSSASAENMEDVIKDVPPPPELTAHEVDLHPKAAPANFAPPPVKQPKHVAANNKGSMAIKQPGGRR